MMAMEKLIKVVIVAGTAQEGERIARFTDVAQGEGIIITHEDALRGLEFGRCVFLLGRDARPEFEPALKFAQTLGAVVLSISLRPV